MNFYFVVQLLIQCILNITEHNLPRMYCYRVHCTVVTIGILTEKYPVQISVTGYLDFFSTFSIPEWKIHSNTVNMSKAASVLIIVHYHLSLLLDNIRSSHFIAVKI
jgi:hypothetical protein